MNNSLLIDSHCHLNYDYLPKSLEDILGEAQLAGVESLVTIGTDLASIGEIQTISEKYPNVYHTVGVHPHDAVVLKPEDMPILEKAGRHPKCRAIGEIGLDYHYDHSPRDVQKSALKLQLDLARQLGLPVVIHSREGEEDLLQALTEYSRQLPADAIPGIIHCFSGTVAFGQACVELGFYISFSGILTFKKADEVRTAAQLFPLDRILVETDAPFLAPIPYRGKKCEPSMVKVTALKLAELRGISFEEVARATTANSKRVFRI
ncbi:MAG: TatD family hydrolase [Bdellovibrionia bacterium]